MNLLELIAQYGRECNFVGYHEYEMADVEGDDDLTAVAQKRQDKHRRQADRTLKKIRKLIGVTES